MDFTLTDDEELLRSSARSLLAKECAPSLVRAHIDDPSAADPLWKQLAEWTALASGPLVQLCLFLEETGYAAAPGPFFATTALFRPLMAAAGQQVNEGVSGTVAIAGADGEWWPNDDPTKCFVLEADRVDRVAVVHPGPTVVVVEPPVAARPVGTLDFSRRVFEVDVPTAAGPAFPITTEALHLVLHRAYVALAAEMVGTSRRLLEMAIDYAKQRVQFDKPIGSFQAVQHKLADMALAQERAWAAVYYAAMSYDAGNDAARSDEASQSAAHVASHVAKAAAGDAAKRCAKDAIQIHGGVGYTWDHDLHLFLRRAYGSEHLLGTTAWHHDRLAELLLDDWSL